MEQLLKPAAAGPARGVVVVAMGWACDPHVAEHLPFPADYDVLWLYDWRTMPADTQSLRRLAEGYERRLLMAWSFGVWAAGQVFASVEFTRAVAFNGTPFPADDRFGIGLRRLRLTLRGLPAQGMDDFLRRAYGDAYGRLRPWLQPRSLQANIDELRTLAELSSQPCAPVLAWDAAVVGSGDLIFPPENMAAYWGDRAKTLPLPHYPFENRAVIGAIMGI